MPSTSKSQQRLMGVAYAVKNGDMQLSDVDASYRDDVEDLVDNMTLKQLKDFAETKHEGLPDKVGEGITPAQISGMGPVSFPNPATGEVGSGDVPAGRKKKDEEEEETSEMKYIYSFKSFLNEKLRK